MIQSPAGAFLWRVVKAMAMGLATALFAAIFWILVQIIVLALSLHGLATTGSGGIGAVSAPILSPITTLICFALGFAWQYRRSGRQRAVSSRS